jgi:hypothetical protein
LTLPADFGGQLKEHEENSEGGVDELKMKSDLRFGRAHIYSSMEERARERLSHRSREKS